MGFDKLDLKLQYRSDADNIVSDFMIPVLKEAKTYKRSVGFFSSSSLQELSIGIQEMGKKAGHIQVICSPKLSQDDIEAIEMGYETRDKVLERALEREKIEPIHEFEEQRLNLLANLIVQGVLEFKLAFTLNSKVQSIYHEKIALFEDENGEKIGFTGSMNESYNAFCENFESIQVYSDKFGREYLKLVEDNFESLWNNKTPKVCVVKFPQVIIDKIKKYANENLDFTADYEQFIKDRVLIKEKKEAVIPDEITLHQYQNDAIEKWKEKQYRGIFDMATGTGKTYTGIGAICKLKEDLKGQLAVVIVCPFTHLVEQWCDDLKKFGIVPIIAYGDAKYKDYENKLKTAIFRYNLGVKSFFCLLTTLDTFGNKKIQNQLEKIQKNRLLVVDEVHNIGAMGYRQYLDERFEYRLGLSATIQRHHDDMGTQALFHYFGEKCIEYTLQMAIDNGYLTRYKYYPVIVYLSQEELEKYNEISSEIESSMRFDRRGKPQLTERTKQLLIDRSRIVAGAENKIGLLKQYMKEYQKEKHILVYCGSAKTKENEMNAEIRQIDQVTKCLRFDLNMRVARFTSREKRKEREMLIEQFSEGEVLQALVAIKCLDEGVNIPAIKTAFILASTTNPKEYIQRRGRVLRLFPGKEFAEIYDFVTLPRELSMVPFLTEKERKYDLSLVRKELERVEEFRSLADNSYDSMETILNIRDAYGIYKEDEDNERMED